MTVLGLPNPFVPDAQTCDNQGFAVTTSQPFASYNWKNDAGNTVSVLANPNLLPGNYEVEVTDLNGCVGDTIFDISGLPSPISSLSAPVWGICAGQVVQIHATNTADGYSYQWFKDATPIAGSGPILYVDQAGVYQAIATNIFGCSANTNLLGIYNCAAQGGICELNTCIPATSGSGNGGGGGGGGGCQFNGNVSFSIIETADCATHQYLQNGSNVIPGTATWSVGGVFSNLDNPTLSFSQPGPFLAYLNAQIPQLGNPANSCTDGAILTDSIKGVARFVSSTACIGAPMSFTDVSEIMATVGITAWAWNFDDPTSGAANTSALHHPMHTYNTPGNYNVTLTISLTGGCQTSITQPVNVATPPNLLINLPTWSCEDIPLAFSASSSVQIAEYAWSFGDATSGAADSSQLAVSPHLFEQAGNYVIHLDILTIAGCPASTTANFTVNPNTLSGIIVAVPASPLCEGVTTVLTAPAGGIWAWESNETTQNITVSQEGLYSVTVSNAIGCSYTTEIIIEYLEQPVGAIQGVEYNEYNQPVAYYNNTYTACEGEEVNLVTQTTSGNSVTWSNGETGTELSFTEEKGNLLTVGTYIFTATLTDNATGCTDNIGPFTVTINPVPSVTIGSMPTGFLCENTNTVLSVNAPDAAVNYFWNTGENATNITAALGGIYFCRGINAFGCIGESNIIEIHNAPEAATVPDGCLIRCNPDTMCIPLSPDVASYQWFQDGVAIPAPNGTQPNAVFTQDGAYQLQMTDIYGCVTMTDTLSLDLYIGYGDISGYVYADVNQNNIIDAADTLLSNISLILSDQNGAIDTVNTTNIGNYLFNDVSATAYQISLDTANLPEIWQAVWQNTNTELVGCDDTSNVVWLLTALCTPDTIQIDTAVCLNDSILIQGQWIHAGQFLEIVLVGNEGCDSVYQINAATLPYQNSSINDASCPGVPLTFFGIQVMPGQTHVFMPTNTFGCQDTVTVTVTALPTDTTNLTFTACPGQPYDYNGTPINAGDSLTVALTNAFGCDSVIIIHVIEAPNPTFSLIADPTCHNTSEGAIHLQNFVGQAPPYTYATDGINFQNTPDFTQLPAGNYGYFVQDAFDCITQDNINIPAIPQLTVSIPDQMLACGDTIIVQPALSNNDFTWLWDNGSNSPERLFAAPGIYSFIAANVCDTINSTFAITIDQTTADKICFVPNIFTPNSDYENDCFGPYFRPDVQVLSFEMRIFDRWGTQIYKTNNTTDCWNGTFKGKTLDPGVFIWFIEATAPDCQGIEQNYRFKGDITIIK